MAIDFEALVGGDNFDPCAVYKAVRVAYYKLVAGESEQKIQFRDRDVWFNKGDLEEIKALMNQLQTECAAAQGVTLKPRRFAATAGTRHVDRGGPERTPFYPRDPFRS